MTTLVYKSECGGNGIDSSCVDNVGDYCYYLPGKTSSDSVNYHCVSNGGFCPYSQPVGGRACCLSSDQVPCGGGGIPGEGISGSDGDYVQCVDKNSDQLCNGQCIADNQSCCNDESCSGTCLDDSCCQNACGSTCLDDKSDASCCGDELCLDESDDDIGPFPNTPDPFGFTPKPFDEPKTTAVRSSEKPKPTRAKSSQPKTTQIEEDDPETSQSKKADPKSTESGPESSKESDPKQTEESTSDGSSSAGAAKTSLPGIRFTGFTGSDNSPRTDAPIEILQTAVPDDAQNDAESACFLFPDYSYTTPSWYTSLPSSAQSYYSSVNVKAQASITPACQAPVAQKDSGLSPEEIAGAVVGSVVGAAALIALLVTLYKFFFAGSAAAATPAWSGVSGNQGWSGVSGDNGWNGVSGPQNMAQADPQPVLPIIAGGYRERKSEDVVNPAWRPTQPRARTTSSGQSMPSYQGSSNVWNPSGQAQCPSSQGANYGWPHSGSPSESGGQAIYEMHPQYQSGQLEGNQIYEAPSDSVGRR